MSTYNEVIAQQLPIYRNILNQTDDCLIELNESSIATVFDRYIENTNEGNTCTYSKLKAFNKGNAIEFMSIAKPFIDEMSDKFCIAGGSVVSSILRDTTKSSEVFFKNSDIDIFPVNMNDEEFKEELSRVITMMKGKGYYLRVVRTPFWINIEYYPPSYRKNPFLIHQFYEKINEKLDKFEESIKFEMELIDSGIVKSSSLLEMETDLKRRMKERADLLKKNIDKMEKPYKLQFVLKRSRTLNDVINGFDIDSSRFAFYRGNFYTNAKGAYSITNGINVVSNVTGGNKYFRRLRKYRDRGFNIFTPLLDKLQSKIEHFKNFDIDIIPYTRYGDAKGYLTNRDIYEFKDSTFVKISSYKMGNHNSDYHLVNKYQFNTKVFYFTSGPDIDRIFDSHHEISIAGVKIMVKFNYSHCGSLLYDGDFTNKISVYHILNFSNEELISELFTKKLGGDFGY